MKTTPPATRPRGSPSRLAFLALAISGVAGCVVIPTPTTPLMGIPAEQRDALRPGETRRADLLMRYGEPEIRLDNDRILVYRWKRMRAAIVTYLLTGIPITDAEALFLEFGPDGRLLRLSTTNAWHNDTIEEQAQAWARGESLMPAPK